MDAIPELLRTLATATVETPYAFPPPKVEKALNASERIAQALSQAHRIRKGISIYIHIPYCIHLCQFCGFVKSQLKSAQQITASLSQLHQEIQLAASFLPFPQSISSIYFGGGTASLLCAFQVEAIIHAIQKRFHVEPNCEITMEGECLTLSKRDYLKDLASLGITRISFGAQVWDEGYRKLLGLLPTVNQLRDLSVEASNLFEEVAVDYIYSLPGTTRSFLQSDLFNFINEIDCSTIEMFRYEPLDSAPGFNKQLSDAGLHPIDWKENADYYEIAVSMAGSKGYDQKSLTLFDRRPKASDFCYYNSYYGWNNGEILGFGRGAQSFFNGLMWGNSLSSKAHEDALASDQFPSDSLNTFSQGSRVLYTWPRKFAIENRLILEKSSKSYLNKIHMLSEAKIISLRKNDLVTVNQSSRGYIPLIMSYLMDDDDSKDYLSIENGRTRFKAEPVQNATSIPRN